MIEKPTLGLVCRIIPGDERLAPVNIVREWIGTIVRVSAVYPPGGLVNLEAVTKGTKPLMGLWNKWWLAPLSPLELLAMEAE
jgi:hypothetical protein